MYNDPTISLDSSHSRAARRRFRCCCSREPCAMLRCVRGRHLASLLYADDRGSISAVGYILITAIVAIGILAGATTIRDQLVQELADFGLGLENLNQSFTVNATYANGDTWNASYTDTPAGNDVPGSSATVSVTNSTPE